MHPTLRGLPEDILICQMSYDDEIDGSWMRFLTDAEIDRRAGMKNEGRKRSFTLGRVALRSLLAGHLGIQPRDVALIVEQSGRLACPNSGLYLSLAHSGDQAIAIAAPRNVGVDMEVIREKPEALLDYILADGERQHIKELPLDFTHSLFLCWTLKEAVLKANGTGLRRSPKKVELAIDLEAGSALATDPEGKTWTARFTIEKEYVLSLAYESKPQ